MLSFQEFIDSCMISAEKNREYFSDLKKYCPTKEYFIEPNWGNVPRYKRAYYCACIEKLFPQSIPGWVYKSEYYLDRPYFPFKDKTGYLNLLLMVESPAQFKIRNIFVSKNCLDEV